MFRETKEIKNVKMFEKFSVIKTVIKYKYMNNKWKRNVSLAINFKKNIYVDN